MNKLYYGDNLDLSPGFADECVDLIYLDPPFKSTAGWAADDRCWTYLVGDDPRKAREPARWKDIPKDPFAKSKP